MISEKILAHQATADQVSAIRDEADFLASEGFSVIPVNSNKQPTLKWKKYQDQIIDQSDLHLFKTPYIAMVCGKISGNLEVIDFDCHDPKNQSELEKIVYDRFIHRIFEAGLSDTILQHAVITKTPSGGFHFITRYDQQIGGHLTLSKWSNGETMIETRSEGNYAVIPPSPGYEYQHGDKFYPLNPISIEHRDFLHKICRDATLYREPPTSILLNSNAKKIKAIETAPKPKSNIKAGDDYSQNADHRKLLEKHGWTLASTDGSTENWTRPGKNPSDGHSATWGHVAPRKFYVFSSNAQPLQSDRSYDLFGLFARLEHGGDLKKATKAVVAQGFGSPPSTPSSTPPISDETNPHLEKSILDGIEGTDGAFSRHLRRLYGENILWCDKWGKWLVWSGRHWEIDQKKQIYKIAENVSRDLLKIAFEAKDADTRSKYARFACKCDTHKARRNVLEFTKAYVPTHPDDLDRHHHLLPCQNGTIDLKSGAMTEHKRSHLMTKFADASYDPTARSPQWEKFVEQILPDPDVREFMQRAIGNGATGSVASQVFIVMFGTGANGKSTFLEVIDDVLSDFSQTIEQELLLAKKHETHSTGLADLKGARLAYISEVEKGRRLDEGVIKKLTGDGKIKARFMRQDHFEFDATHTIFYAVNHKPEIRDTTLGMWRRVRLVPFTTTIKEKDRIHNLKAKLLEDRDAILTWIVAGAVKWYRDGLNFPEGIRDATKEYRSEMDQMGRFIAEECKKDPRSDISSTALYEHYKRWCEDSGEYTKSITRFGRELKERGLLQQRSEAGNVWLGIDHKS